MKIATVNEIKQELNVITPAEVKKLCLRLAAFKKENKELLSYLLFEAHNEHGYIESIKYEMDEEFMDLPKANLHLTKKSIRRILRTITKYGRYTGSAQSQIEMLIYFCGKLKSSGIPIHKSPALENMYSQQLKKINKLLASLHEDLRFDYSKQLELLEDGEFSKHGLLRWLNKK
jgi:hypothetical protein